MELIAQAVKDLVVFGPLAVLIAGTMLGALLLHGRPPFQRWGRRWLTVLAITYWLLSVPIGADSLAAPLRAGLRPVAAPDQARGATAIVILSGGYQFLRANADFR